MIQEIKLNGLNNEPVKTNKKPTPKSTNNNLTSCYFSAMFLGAKNSGKTTGLCKLIHNYEQYPIKDYQGHTLPIRTILFAPTAYSQANPIYQTLKSLDENDIILQYSDDILNEKIDSIEQDKQDIEDYNEYLKAWKKYMLIDEDMSLLSNDELLILSKLDFADPEYIKKPKYKYAPVIFMILDDMIGTNECFKKGNCLIANITIKHRHLGINLIFTTQNPRSINNIIRNNIDIWAIYKFSNIKMILEKVYDEVSNILTEQQFEEAYKHATTEPHDALIIDTHPETSIDKRLRRNFDNVLIVN
jgi:hypothetical protein